MRRLDLGKQLKVNVKHIERRPQKIHRIYRARNYLME